MREIQEQLRKDILEERERAVVILNKNLAESKIERDKVRAEINKQINDQRSEFNINRTARQTIEA